MVSARACVVQEAGGRSHEGAGRGEPGSPSETMRVQRFHSSRALRSVRLQGMRVERGGVGIYCRRAPGGAHRIAVTCGRAVSRRAVVRNRIRRVFYEAMRLTLKDAAVPVECVIQVRPGFDSRDLDLRKAESIVSVAAPLLSRL